jgi:hypothetical protein
MPKQYLIRLLGMNKRKLLKMAIDSAGYKEAKNKSNIDFDSLLDIISLDEYNLIFDGVAKWGCNKNTITRFLSRSFPDRNAKIDRKVCKFLLNKIGLRICPSCSDILPSTEYNLNKSINTGYANTCRLCAQAYRMDSYYKDPQKEIQANNARKRNIYIPAWANIKKINEIYANRPEGMHVDHVIPVNGELVCGFHIETNLQYLTVDGNLSKGNKYSIA